MKDCFGEAVMKACREELETSLVDLASWPHCLKEGHHSLNLIDIVKI